ncbi:MAG: phosphotransferase [Acidimicrobiales bacterium]
MDLDVTVLGQGWANKNFLVRRGDGRYVVKILTQAMGDLALSVPVADIMRNTELAGRAGVGARVIQRLDDPPTLVLEYLDGRTLEPTDITIPAMAKRIATAICRLHRRTEAFHNYVSVWEFIDRYLALVERHGLQTPSGLLAMLPTVRRIADTLGAREGRIVPSQIDTYAWNLIDVGDDIRIIDYDFSGMTDELFDVGDVAMEGDLDPDSTARFVESYFGRHDPTLVARTQLYGIAAQYMWSLLFTDMAQLLPELPSQELDYFGEATLRFSWVERQVERLRLGNVLEAAIG